MGTLRPVAGALVLGPEVVADVAELAEGLQEGTLETESAVVAGHRNASRPQHGPQAPLGARHALDEADAATVRLVLRGIRDPRPRCDCERASVGHVAQAGLSHERWLDARTGPSRFRGGARGLEHGDVTGRRGLATLVHGDRPRGPCRGGTQSAGVERGRHGRQRRARARRGIIREAECSRCATPRPAAWTSIPAHGAPQRSRTTRDPAPWVLKPALAVDALRAGPLGGPVPGAAPPGRDHGRGVLPHPTCAPS